MRSEIDKMLAEDGNRTEVFDFALIIPAYAHTSLNGCRSDYETRLRLSDYHLFRSMQHCQDHTINYPLLQCFKCLGFGHTLRRCQETKEKCVNCGGEHRSDACLVKDSGKFVRLLKLVQKFGQGIARRMGKRNKQVPHRIAFYVGKFHRVFGTTLSYFGDDSTHKESL